MVYHTMLSVIVIHKTANFEKWLKHLKDSNAKYIIARRLTRIESGNLGDVKSVGNNVSELRIDYGPGYRVYFTWRGKRLIVLLAGGVKSSQSRDIKKAQELAKEEHDAT